MMAEPTLGQRILDAATWWTECVDSGDQAGQGDAQTALRALCARADAAERLAEATVFRDEAMADESETHRPGYRSDIPNVVFAVRLLAAKEVYSEALAAWRAINGEVQP